ncbi:uncharacterized protein LOC120084997 [Benincasa hispida]|uniref:uncharacterized protein LOC120084997 n=1 Tax=Benincasa hispida TaxID=102211 RepID=UPI0019008935|nr:uncharacterized protein LOC120084997 [Benincasa hispida]
MVALTQDCNMIIPSKMRDPRSFIIPRSIGGIYIGHALCNLRASINLMPLSIFKRLEIGKLTPTDIILQLADQSLVHLEGRLEDVLVKVDKFILPPDFIIRDYKADKDVPIILGQPFLSTGRAQINVHKEEIAVHVNGQKLKFNIIKAMNYPDEVSSSNIDEEWSCSLNWGIDEEIESKEETTPSVESCYAMTEFQNNSKSLNTEERESTNKSSLEQPSILELKVLPVHLKYTFLKQNDTLPVIISPTLSREKEATLLEVLKK